MKLLLGRLKPKKGNYQVSLKGQILHAIPMEYVPFRLNFPSLQVKNYDFTVTISLFVLSEMTDHFVEAHKNNGS
jgi:hypothetical protein